MGYEYKFTTKSGNNLVESFLDMMKEWVAQAMDEEPELESEIETVATIRGTAMAAFCSAIMAYENIRQEASSDWEGDQDLYDILTDLTIPVAQAMVDEILGGAKTKAGTKAMRDILDSERDAIPDGVPVEELPEYIQRELVEQTGLTLDQMIEKGLRVAVAAQEKESGEVAFVSEEESREILEAMGERDWDRTYVKGEIKSLDDLERKALNKKPKQEPKTREQIISELDALRKDM